jgi:uncharacterized protein with GYD domain
VDCIVSVNSLASELANADDRGVSRHGRKEATMPLYMFEFGYTAETWAGLVRSPENREESVARILEDAGCKLHNLWYTFGESDGFALIEAPDNATAAGLSIAIGSSGAFRKAETHVLMAQSELLDALGKAGDIAYAAPGAGVTA